jgi:hypothetical protein
MSFLNQLLNKTDIDDKFLGFINKKKEEVDDWSRESLTKMFGSIRVSGTGDAHESVRDAPNSSLSDTQPGMTGPPVAEAAPIEEEPAQSKFHWVTEDKQPFPKEWDGFVDSVSSSYGHDPEILASLIANESGHTWEPTTGDTGASFGYTQVQYPTYVEAAEWLGENALPREEFIQAVQDPQTSIDIAGKVLRMKTDRYADGDPFLGVVRYNGDGPDAIEYAKAVYRRIGREIPEGY